MTKPGKLVYDSVNRKRLQIFVVNKAVPKRRSVETRIDKLDCEPTNGMEKKSSLK